eukprot:scaffold803_cov310-Pinguiococcus_pyrenoidosus.AAC.121
MLLQMLHDLADSGPVSGAAELLLLLLRPAMHGQDAGSGARQPERKVRRQLVDDSHAELGFLQEKRAVVAFPCNALGTAKVQVHGGDILVLFHVLRRGQDRVRVVSGELHDEGAGLCRRGAVVVGLPIGPSVLVRLCEVLGVVHGRPGHIHPVASAQQAKRQLALLHHGRAGVDRARDAKQPRDRRGHRPLAWQHGQEQQEGQTENTEASRRQRASHLRFLPPNFVCLGRRIYR